MLSVLGDRPLNEMQPRPTCTGIPAFGWDFAHPLKVEGFDLQLHPNGMLLILHGLYRSTAAELLLPSARFERLL